MRKKTMITMLEFLNDDNNWSWFAVYKKKTPKQAIKDYLDDHGIEFDSKDIKKNSDGELYYEDHCLAHKIELQ